MTRKRMLSDFAIDEFIAIGKAAWPGLSFEPTGFGAHLAALASRAEPPLVAHAADLHLAYACASGVRGALAEFDMRYAATLARAAARAAKSEDMADEAAQVLRVKLFVDVPPRILDYRGRAKLATWLATAVARTALNLIEARGRHDSLHTGQAIASVNPELHFVRAKYGGEIGPILTLALTKLSDKDRAILRLHFVERMSIDALAAVYRVGRSTAARWLVAARESLLEHCRNELRARFDVTASELQSIGRDLASQLEVSLLRYL